MGTSRHQLNNQLSVALMEETTHALASHAAKLDQEMATPEPLQQQQPVLFRSIREALESEKVVTEEPGGYVVIKRKSQATQTELSTPQEDPAGYTVIRHHNVAPVARGGSRSRHSRGSHHATGQRSGRSTAERHPIHRRRLPQQQERKQLSTRTQATEAKISSPQPLSQLPVFTADLAATSPPASAPAQSWTSPTIGGSSLADVPMEPDAGSWAKTDESALGGWGPSMWLNSSDPSV